MLHLNADMLHPMHWDHANTFLAVYRRHSLRAAGRELGVDQATIGRRLSALEDELGGKLFVRTPDGYFPTLVSDRLLDAAERMEQAALDMARIARGANTSHSGQVRVATGDGLAQAFVVKAMTRVRQSYPGIDVTLILDREIADLPRDEADLAVRVIKPEKSDLIVRRLGTIESRLYASSDYINRRGPPTRGARFAGHDLIMPTPLRNTPLELCGEAFDEDRVTLRANSMMARAEAAQEGLGIALLLDAVAAKFTGLSLIWPEMKTFYTVWLVVHPDLRRTTRVRAVFEAIEAVFNIQFAD